MCDNDKNGLFGCVITQIMTLSRKWCRYHQVEKKFFVIVTQQISRRSTPFWSGARDDTLYVYYVFHVFHVFNVLLCFNVFMFLIYYINISICSISNQKIPVKNGLQVFCYHIIDFHHLINLQHPFRCDIFRKKRALCNYTELFPAGITPGFIFVLLFFFSCYFCFCHAFCLFRFH